MIDLELTPEIKKWLDADPDKRDLRKGAELLLRVTRNRILYNNIITSLERRADAIEYHLSKIYKQRLIDITHEQVTAMMKDVDAINRARGLDQTASSVERTELQRGKRADHDELPDDIRQLYVDNADIMRRMRDYHTKLRLISPQNSSCPDSDRYPYAKEIIALDKLYRENWNKYDHYIKGTPSSATVLAQDPRSASKNAAKLCNLLLGKYARLQDDATAERIRQAYALVDAPSAKLTEKMKAAGLE